MSDRDARPVESPGRLFWRQLHRSPLAVAGGLLLIVLYGMSALAPFLAPYAESDIDRDRFFHPPTPLHLRHADGRWTLRPFVYGSRGGMDQSYEPDRTREYPVRLFVKGAPYRLFGVFPADRHLFGVDPPGRIFIMGRLSANKLHTE